MNLIEKIKQHLAPGLCEHSDFLIKLVAYVEASEAYLIDLRHWGFIDELDANVFLDWESVTVLKSARRGLGIGEE